MLNYSYSEMMPFMCAEHLLSNESVEIVDSHFSCLSWSDKVKVRVAQSCLALCNPLDYTVHGILQARILEWVAFSLLQDIFLTQESNPGLLHCTWILYQQSHKGSPRLLEWVAYPFSRGSSQLRNQTRVSCIAGGFFTN